MLRRAVAGLLILLAMCLAAGAAAAETLAADVMPIQPDPDSIDPDNGWFSACLEDIDRIDEKGWFTLALYRTDEYDLEQIEHLAPGTTLLVNGEKYTVAEEVVPRDVGWFDEEQLSWDVVTEEECWGGLWFMQYGEKTCAAYLDDWVPVTPVARIRVMLPLPDRFVLNEIPGGEEPVPCTADEFLARLRDGDWDNYNQYNSMAHMENGELTELVVSGYPHGPAVSGAEDAYDETDDEDAPARLAGYYICFEEENGVPTLRLRQGILTISDGMISEISGYRENEPDTVYLDPACVILPGLLDLHSHIDYNNLQLWISDEAGSLWDNRFEWRASDDYRTDLKDKFAELQARWEEVLYPGEIPVTRGDMLEYFTELQAAAGGTTLIQGANKSDTAYEAANSHEKLRIIRSTALPEDLGRNDGRPVISMTQIYLPDAQMSPDDPYSYLPPIDTSSWGTTHAMNSATGRDRLEELLEGIADKTEQGYLIHLAEGRAGYLAPETDAYSRLEFDTFRRDLTDAVNRGLFTPEDVRNAHIGLIHACAVDLTNPEDAAFLKEYGIGLIWSPVSNLLLYADTPDFFRFMDDPDLLIALGSDWSPSGSKAVWEEAWFAYDLITILDGETDTTRENLLKACTVIPAKILGNDRLGNIREGAFADLFILRADGDIGGDPAAALDVFVTGDDRNTEAVLTRGVAVYGTKDFLAAFTGDQSLSDYGCYTDDESDLHYFLIPDLFRGKPMADLYAKYEEILTEAQLEMSPVRVMEDPLYSETMDDVKETLTR